MVRCVCDTEVKIRELMLENIALDDLKTGFDVGALDTFVKLNDHARIELIREHFFGSLEEFNSEITGSWPDFEDSVGGFDACFLDDGIYDKRIAEDVLSVRFFEVDAAVAMGCFGGLLRTATFGYLAHP